MDKQRAEYRGGRTESRGLSDDSYQLSAFCYQLVKGIVKVKEVKSALGS